MSKPGTLLKPTPAFKDVKKPGATNADITKTLAKTKSDATAGKVPVTTEGKTKLPRNVNEYKHLMHGSMTSEASLEWVLELRSQQPANAKAKLRSPSGPPSFVKREVAAPKHCEAPEHDSGPHVLLVEAESIRKRSSEVVAT